MYQVTKLTNNKVYKDDQGIKWQLRNKWAITLNGQIVTTPSSIIGDMSRVLELYDTKSVAQQSADWFNR